MRTIIFTSIHKLTPASIHSFLTSQLSGIAFLTLLPFLISGIIFNPWNTEMIQSLAAATPYIYPPWVSGLLAMMCLMIITISKNMAFMMPLFSSLILLAMGLKQYGWLLSENSDWNVFYTLYTFTSLLTFPIIALYPTLSSWLFRTLLILLSIDMIITISAPSYALLAPFFIAYFPSHISIIICTLIIVFLRMLRKFYVENAQTRQQLRELSQNDPLFRKTLRIKTLSLWWPMLFVFLLFTLGYQLLQERYINRPLIEHLNKLGTDIPVKIYEDQDNVEIPFHGDFPDTVENASKAAVSRLSAAQAYAIKQRIDQQMSEAGSNKKAAYNAVKNSMPNRFPGTKTKSCAALDVDCYGANIAKSTINSAYLSAKNSMLADLQLKLNAIEGSGKEAAGQIRAVINETFLSFETHTNRRISNTATGMRYINLAALIYGILILSKSLMIVFARVFYARVSTTPAHKLDDNEIKNTQSPAANGRMKKANHKYTIQREDGPGRYYINFRCCGNNVIDRRRMPQPFSLILKRIISRNYIMCQIDLHAHEDVSECDIIVDPPAEIIVWDLDEQDEIYIDMRALIGFSDSCRLGRTISLSLGSLIFGKAIYYSIKGPGRIFIRTASSPIAGRDKNVNNVMQASSLIAWQRGTSFNVISSLTRRDTFFSGYSIRKFGRKSHLVIYDSSQTRRVSAGQGIFKMARAFLVPF